MAVVCVYEMHQSLAAGEIGSAASIRDRIAALGPWLHPIELLGIRVDEVAPATELNPEHTRRWDALAGVLPKQMHGWQVLDAGCLDGYYSMQLAERGARVVALDSWNIAVDRVRFIAGLRSELDIVPTLGDIYNLPDDHYDLILCVGVIYTLENPMLALREPAAKTDWLLIGGGFSEHQEPVLAFQRSATADAVQWVPSRTGLQEMLKAVGFDDVQPVDYVEAKYGIYSARKS